MDAVDAAAAKQLHRGGFEVGEKGEQQRRRGGREGGRRVRDESSRQRHLLKHSFTSLRTLYRPNSQLFTRREQGRGERGGRKSALEEEGVRALALREKILPHLVHCARKKGCAKRSTREQDPRKAMSCVTVCALYSNSEVYPFRKSRVRSGSSPYT